MRIIKTLNILVILILLSSVIKGQIGNSVFTKTDTFRVNFENLYELSSISIIPTSETVSMGNREISKNDYLIDLTSNTLSLSDTLSYSIFDTIYITYSAYNLSLKKKYQNRILVQKYDDRFQDTISVVKSKGIDLSSKGIFGKDLQSSGTLLRGFSLGTNKDLTVNSGLRLQLSGKISEDIEIIAALTDENTPIQPEGNTERLEELDKVFIEIKHRNASGVFGDYNYQSNIGEFGKVDRKLQGVLGKVNIDNYGGSVAFASSRGKFNSMQISGIDGVQGPYRLMGANNENDIIVIAGSEKIFLDGRQLKRGENNDYTIEYSNGELTFTPKIIITSLSRIIADFEYTNRQYERNIIGANAFANFFDNKLSIKLNAYQEGDNRNSPIDLSLSDFDKNILEQSGDDPFEASISGAIEIDSDTLGIYSVTDSTINGEQIKIYIYNPGSSLARFNVSFSFVGENNGDYLRESIGKFKFVGIGQGSYLPIRLLPLPEKNQLGNIVIDYSPIEQVAVKLELAASSYDKNTFSNLDDNDNNGFARSFSVNIKPIKLNIAESNYGKITASFKDRYKDEKFKTVDRIDEVEFDRHYNTSGSLNNEETLREFKLNYLPTENISLAGQYGLLKRGSNFNSERILTKLNVNNFNNINLQYDYDFVSTEANIQNSNWIRQNGNISYNIWKLQPGLEFRAENKEENLNNIDSLLVTSLQYFEYSPFLLLTLSKGFNFNCKIFVH